MTGFNIGHYRLFHQGISEANFEQPSHVVAHLGAIQAQDYASALWAIGLRTKNLNQVDVEQAIINRTIVRTWPMRGTLHFVAADDVRWMLKLLTPRIISASAARQRQLEIDSHVLAHSQTLIIKALENGKQLTRPQLFQVLEAGGVSTSKQRGIHILGRLSQEGVLCLGSHLGKQPTFVLLDEWLPPTKLLQREEALAELASRYFTGHGPATVRDFEKWAGLKTSDAKAGLEMVKRQLRQEIVAGESYWLSQSEVVLSDNLKAVHLLPGFDEYILGYKDREAVLEEQYFQRVVPGGNGVFMPTTVSNGQVVGIWKRVVNKDKLLVSSFPFSVMSQSELEYFAIAAARYGQFMSKSVEKLNHVSQI